MPITYATEAFVVSQVRLIAHTLIEMNSDALCQGYLINGMVHNRSQKAD